MSKTEAQTDTVVLEISPPFSLPLCEFDAISRLSVRNTRTLHNIRTNLSGMQTIRGNASTRSAPGDAAIDKGLMKTWVSERILSFSVSRVNRIT